MDIRPLIFQMCADRLGQSGNPAAAQLLARMNATDGGAPPDMREIIDGLGAADPTMRLLAQHLEATQSARTDNEGPDLTIDVDNDGEGSSARDAEVAAIQELRAQAESMFRELEALRMRNDDLALALGACPVCWGEDTQCRGCRGRGGPGFARPDTEAFLHYVVPAGKTWRLFRGLEKRGSYAAISQSTPSA